MSENQVITNMENEVEEMTSIHYLNQDNAVFERTEGGFLLPQFHGSVLLPSESKEKNPAQ